MALQSFRGSPPEPLRTPDPAFDVHRRYVRFRELNQGNYVLFDFAIGDPELWIELILPVPAYQTFCRENAVTYLTREQEDAVDHERSKWRYGQPGMNNEQEQDG